MPPIKIAVADLQPGMYVVDTGISWLKAPMLYAEQGLIASEEKIAEIIGQGYTEAYYDPEQSHVCPKQEMSLDGAGDAPRKDEARAPLAEELVQARTVYADSFRHVKKFMRSIQSGPVDIAASEPYVESIISSLSRNADALISLSKLKTYDEYTYVHSVNVTIFAVAFARYLGFDDSKLHLVGMAGLFHDIGKELIPPEILNAPRRLTDAEFEIMRSHALLGYEELKKVEGIAPEILAGVVQHHEKHNGTGYPRRLVGRQISIYAHILSVADCYDALSARRVYKEPLPPSKALGIMYGMRGEAWKPDFVENFIKMLGIYPVGTLVELSTGHRGVVSRSNHNFPAQPCVIVAQSPEGQPLAPRTMDLAAQRNVSITRTLKDDEAAGFDVLALLGDQNAEAALV